MLAGLSEVAVFPRVHVGPAVATPPATFAGLRVETLLRDDVRRVAAAVDELETVDLPLEVGQQSDARGKLKSLDGGVDG